MLRQAQHCSARLSVSSVGSSGMQHTVDRAGRCRERSFSILGRIERDATLHPRRRRLHRHHHFQYPRSDRAGCNVSTPPPSEGCAPGFQYPRSDRAGCNGVGVEVRQTGCGVFQYPRSDRAGCNEFPHRTRRCGICRFQYPRSDRAGCNKSLGGDVVGHLTTFSILGRIERDATSGPGVNSMWPT